MSSPEIETLELACKKVLELPKILFVGILNKMGNKIAGGFKEGIKPFLPDKENRNVCPTNAGIHDAKRL